MHPIGIAAPALHQSGVAQILSPAALATPLESGLLNGSPFDLRALIVVEALAGNCAWTTGQKSHGRFTLTRRHTKGIGDVPSHDDISETYREMIAPLNAGEPRTSEMSLRDVAGPKELRELKEPTEDYWWQDCGQIVTEDDPVISSRSTDWTKDLRQLSYEVRKCDAAQRLKQRAVSGRQALDTLSARLAKTVIGKARKKQRATVEMNARYRTVKGQRIYFGKRASDAKKQRRAEAARARRALERAQTHDDNSATDQVLS